MNLITLSFVKPIFLAVMLALGAGCSSDKQSENKSEQQATETTNRTATADAPNIQQGNPETGVGPFKEVDLGADVNMSLAEQGKTLFEGRCTACHKFDERFVGPPLAGVTERRNPVWIMNMIINPTEMVEKDPIAKELLAEYQAPMMNMGVNEEDTRAILEYLRAHDQGKLN